MLRDSPPPRDGAIPGRRSTLRSLAAIFLAGTISRISVGHARGAKNRVCADPKVLGEVERRQRSLDNYTELSTDPAKTCSRCDFFTSGADPTACGRCAVFNGPASPQGKCDDWVARRP
jgi:hypothetical protein